MKSHIQFLIFLLIIQGIFGTDYSELCWAMIDEPNGDITINTPAKDKECIHINLQGNSVRILGDERDTSAYSRSFFYMNDRLYFSQDTTERNFNFLLSNDTIWIEYYSNNERIGLIPQYILNKNNHIFGVSIIELSNRADISLGTQYVGDTVITINNSAYDCYIFRENSLDYIEAEEYADRVYITKEKLLPIMIEYRSYYILLRKRRWKKKDREYSKLLYSKTVLLLSRFEKCR